MTTTRTIDVKGKEHAEKEGLIFLGVESLKDFPLVIDIASIDPKHALVW